MGTDLRPDGQDRRIVAPIGMRFGIDDLRRVRGETTRWSRRAGMLPERAADFMIAVNEIATNAVRHGSPTASLTLRVTRGHAAGAMAEAEIRDSGSWRVVPGAGPGGAEHGGMGLSLARSVCDAVEIRAGRAGTTVILRMRLAARGA